MAKGIIFAAAGEGTAEAPGVGGAGGLAAGSCVASRALTLPLSGAHAPVLAGTSLAEKKQHKSVMFL